MFKILNVTIYLKKTPLQYNNQITQAEAFSENHERRALLTLHNLSGNPSLELHSTED